MNKVDIHASLCDKLLVEHSTQGGHFIGSTEQNVHILKTDFESLLDNTDAPEAILMRMAKQCIEWLTASRGGMSFKDITLEMNDLYARKNADYGDSFSISFEKLGVMCAVTRIYDKVNRIETLALSGNRQRVTDESLADTLMDLANYSLMTVMEFMPKVALTQRDADGSCNNDR